jgi:hypothetical protein
MAVTREAAIEALASVLKNAYAFGAVTRRVDSPNTLAAPGTPGLGIIVHSESYSRPSPNRPPVRKMKVMAIIYIDASGPANVNIIPDAILNPIKDAFDAALAPDNAVTGLCTLGGVVYAAYISGDVEQAPGDMTGKGLAAMPVEIILP